MLIALAAAQHSGHTGGIGPAGAAAVELALGVAIGVAVGGIGGYLVKVASGRGWVAGSFAGSSVLALAVCAYACALALHGNGFVAAFVGGLAFRAPGGQRGERLVPFVEETSALVSLLVWLAFGAVAVVPAFERLTWPDLAYAVLSLTLLRMVPVAIALAGARLGRTTVAFIGWFGPRGLASVVFALLAIEEIGEGAAGSAITIIVFTVLLSVVAHGVTADPLARRYGPSMPQPPAAGDDRGTPLPERRLIRRAS